MSPLVCMRPCDLHSLRCKQCLAWLDFMASSTAMTEMLKIAALTSQLPCGIYPVMQTYFQIKLVPPSQFPPSPMALQAPDHQQCHPGCSFLTG